MSSKLLNFAGFQLGWFAAVLCAAAGRPWLGAAALAVLLALHYASCAQRARELRLGAEALALGVALDSALMASGALRCAGWPGAAWIAPAWLNLLWPLFAATLHGCFAWILGRKALASLLGALAAPLSYWAGVRMGALEFPRGLAPACAWIAAGWALALPWLVARAGPPRR